MRFLAAFALLCSLAVSANAQTPTLIPQATLQNNVNSLFPDNVTGLITPFDARSVLLDITVPEYITVTDGTHTVSPITHLTVSGLTIGGTSPNATMSVNAVGTVTSVSITPGNGILQSGSPITGSGAITVSANIATNSNIWSGTANKLIDAAGAASAIAPVTVNESSSTFNIDFHTGINFELPLNHADCPCAVASPANVYAGLSGNITLIQSATGSDTIGTWGSTWKFSQGLLPTLTTTANAVDVLPFYCRTTTFCVVSFIGNPR